MFQHVCLQSGLVLLLLSCCARQLSHIHHSSGFFIIMSPAEGSHFSALVCLFVMCESAYLVAIALRLQWIAFTQQVIS